MGITDRLRRLEDGSRSSCVRCGQPNAAAYESIYIRDEATYEEAVSGAEHCPGCGRTILQRVYFTDRRDTLPVVVVKTRARSEEGATR
jgi:hypothetical protein